MRNWAFAAALLALAATLLSAATVEAQSRRRRAGRRQRTEASAPREPAPTKDEPTEADTTPVPSADSDDGTTDGTSEDPGGPTAPQAAARAAAPNGPTWAFRLEVDLPVLLLSATLAVPSLLADQLPPSFCAPECPKDDLIGIDRWVAGRYNEDWALASDVAVVGMFVSSAVALVATEDFAGGLVDFLIVAETVAATTALTTIANLMTTRPRPLLYDDNAPLEERLNGRATLSFWSGHTANAFAAATAVFVTARERDPEGTGPYIWLASSYVLATFVAAGRMLSGSHFLTDTLAGAVVGISMGWLVPSLHTSRMTPAIAPTEGGGTVGVAGQF